MSRNPTRLGYAVVNLDQLRITTGPYSLKNALGRDARSLLYGRRRTAPGEALLLLPSCKCAEVRSPSLWLRPTCIKAAQPKRLLQKSLRHSIFPKLHCGNRDDAGSNVYRGQPLRFRPASSTIFIDGSSAVMRRTKAEMLIRIRTIVRSWATTGWPYNLWL